MVTESTALVAWLTALFAWLTTLLTELVTGAAAEVTALVRVLAKLSLVVWATGVVAGSVALAGGVTIEVLPASGEVEICTLVVNESPAVVAIVLPASLVEGCALVAGIVLPAALVDGVVTESAVGSVLVGELAALLTVTAVVRPS